jgi:hypothetical protein
MRARGLSERAIGAGNLGKPSGNVRTAHALERQF